MRLHQFILENLEGIQQEWEDFAADYLSDADGMNKDQLRDHLCEMLHTIAADLARPQSAKDQIQKAKGQQISDGAVTAAATHGTGRLAAGFSLNSTISEFRALRASVTRLWIKRDFKQSNAETDLGDLIRFNEAIDQAITESVVGYSNEKESDSRMFETILTACPDLVFTFNLEGKFVYANKKLLDLFGLSMEHMAGKNYYDLNVSIAAQLHEQIEQAIRTKASINLEAPYTPFSGKLIWYDYVFTPVLNKRGDVESVICIGRDVTERRASEHHNWIKANYDDLTGLPNRSLFTNRLEEYVKHSHRSGSSIALLFIDLDYFKEINDHFGHEAGDNVLKQTAERIQSCIRESDTAARLGGDEFIVLLDNIQNPRHVESVAEKIRQRLSESFHLGDRTLQVSASIGVSLSLQDKALANELINHADAAMYTSKNKGRNQVNFFSPEQTE